MVLLSNTRNRGHWRARYAWSRLQRHWGLTVCYFRKRFEIYNLPESFIVYVTADSRYKLWVNGQLVGRGPLKGTLEHYHYETYELTPYLRQGQNILAAEVRWFGSHAPVSEVHSRRPAFLLQGPEPGVVDTPNGWKVLKSEAVQADATPYISNALQFLGHMELVDARELPLNWRTLKFDDRNWVRAVDVGPAEIPDTWGELHPIHSLYPRDIPAILEEDRFFIRVIRHSGHLVIEEPHIKSIQWELASWESGELVLDAGELTTGYPVLEFIGGQDREVHITYSECVVSIEDRDGYKINHKAIRDDFTFGNVEGYKDKIVLPAADYTYEPFHWRTFWYIKIQVEAAAAPFILKNVYYKFTTYPQSLVATFNSAIPDTQQLWKVSWHTLQLCAHETYEDCPYFEQLNYIADTRLQALCSMVLSGETALPRRSIRLFRDSVRPDGLVESRVPSVIPQVKPYFALLWVLMVEDYWRWTGDAIFTHSNLNVVDSVLWFFREHVGIDGLVGKLPYWHMVDRVSGWPGGTPPAVSAGGSTYMSSLYVMALDAAVRLHNQVGYPHDADRWQSQADATRKAVCEMNWDEKAGLFLDGPGRRSDGYSQHSQVMAILAGVATKKQQERILQRLTSDSRLQRMKYMQSFYLARALENAGVYREFSPHVLSLWRDALGKHLTTWPEYPDPTRSDCHAWSSWIAADFITCILGIQPLIPGFRQILLKPQIYACQFAEGSAPTPVGKVSVSWERKQENEIILHAQVPKGISTTVMLPGAVSRRYSEGGEIEYTGKIIPEIDDK
jgi:alpha-L-rhamnosidase